MLDVFKENIFGMVAILDIYNMACVNKEFNGVIGRKTMEKSIIVKINDIFNDVFGDKVNKFKQLLGEYNGVVSGDFILECILNLKILDTHKKSSIVIYVGKNGFSIINKFFSQINNIYVSGSWNHINNNIRYSSYTIESRKYSITVKTPVEISLEEYMDIDNCFDIHKNYYKYEKGCENIIISNLNDILNKDTNFYFDYNLTGCLDKYKKYVGMGFTFKNIVNKNIIFNIKENKNKGKRMYKIIDDKSGIAKTEYLPSRCVMFGKMCDRKCVNGHHKHLKIGSSQFIFKFGGK